MKTKIPFSIPRHIARFLVIACAILFAVSAFSTAQGMPVEDPDDGITDARPPNAPGDISFLSGPNAGDPLDIALNYLKSQVSTMGLKSADFDDLTVTDQYQSKDSGVTHIYLRQDVNGIGIHGANININIASDGSVINLGNSFVPDAANAINSKTPEISANEAVSFAADALDLGATQEVAVLDNVGGAANEMVLSDAGISQDPIPAKLVYVSTTEGILRLAWDLVIYENSSLHWWNVRIDATTGKMLSADDWVVNENHNDGDGVSFDLPHGESRNIEASVAAQFDPGVADSSSYRIYALPIESPDFGSRTLEAEPANPIASPFGWHDTNGDITPDFTDTRGNNVEADTDTNGDNVPDGNKPSSATLDFDFPIDESMEPSTYQPAAITNLFAQNNIMHDVTYLLGFDEAAGNFQTNNYGNGGLGADPVNADAQDGSGFNNANFGTPPDGQRPRMQMFILLRPLTKAVTVNSPGSIAGVYPATISSAGGETNGITGNVVAVEDSGGDPFDGCEAFTNGGAINGNIAILQWNGNCGSNQRVGNAAAAGAIAVIIIDSDAVPSGFAGNAAIPSLSLGQADGQSIKDELDNANTVNVTFGDNPTPPFPANRDGDLDNSVIWHEYGHGISNRLTGGPAAAGCLSNAEQMGEGWSDFWSELLSITPGMDRDEPRYDGAWFTFNPPTGPGIRPAPYTSDLGLNPWTYGDVDDGANISVPHGVGFIWQSMLHEVSWNLIDKYGYNSDFYGDWTTGGNNLAMQLVTDGMKMQPCSPGFVDGRDAILAADLALTGGANQCEIWQGFAYRGLGVSAVQGSSAVLGDETEAFDVPPQCLAPDFFLNASPTTVDVCSPDPVDFTIDIQSTLGFSDPITMTASGVPAGYSEAFNTNPVTPPDTITMTLSNTGAVTPGSYDVLITGMAPTSTHTTTVQIDLFDGVPSLVTLDSPVDTASNVSILPELSWTSADGISFFVEVATNIGFTNIVETATVETTSYQLTTVLSNTTDYYWRVTASNACGAGTTSAIYSFTTVGDGSCEVGEVADIIYFDDMESGAPGYTHGASVDVDTWNLSTAQAFSGQYSYHVVDTAQDSDQYLDAPSINLTLPAGDDNLTLQFQNFQAFEDPAGSGGCWDGGLLEINNGSGWVQLDGELLTDPYDGVGNNGPPVGLDLWCGETNGNQPWTNSVVDLSAYAGDDVEIRWRMLTDAAAGAEGWYIDDVTVQACTAVVGPQIVTDPAISSLGQFPDAVITDTLDISNVGNADLDWTIDEAAGNDCNSPSDISWLSLAPAAGTTISDTLSSVEATFDSTGMVAGVYTGTVCVNSNDVGQPIVEVLATLEVIAEEPNIEVNPTAMSSAQTRDMLVDQTLTISNTGAITLTWAIDEDVAPTVKLLDAANIMMGRQMRDGVDNSVSDGVVSESTLHDVIQDGSFELGSPNPSWTEAGDIASPLCSPGVCGADLARTGSWYVWYGGWGTTNSASVSQDVTIPLGHSNLSLWLAIGATPGVDDGKLEVRMDGNVLATFTEDDAPSYAGYTEVVVDISAYADAGVHTLEIWGEEIGTTTTNFFVDDVSITPPPTCTAPTDVAWLSLTPTAGENTAGTSVDVTVSYDSTGLADGMYDANLCVNSDDPDTPQIIVPVELEVLPSPDIEVNPDALSSLLAPSSSVTHTLTISNVGTADLDWEINEAEADVAVILNATSTTIVETDKSMVSNAHNFSADSVASVLKPATVTQPQGSLVLTHSVSQNIASNLACPSGSNSALRTFTLADFGLLDGFDVTDVEFAVGAIGAGTQTVTVNIYELNGTFVYANMTLVGTADVTVADTDLGSVVSVPVTGSFGPDSTIVVEVASTMAEGTFRIGANDAGQTAPSYIVGPNCGLLEPTDAAAIGFPDTHFVINVVGNASSCDTPTDLSWISIAPANGTTGPALSSDVSVTFDSTGLSAGVYTGNLCIDSNAVENPRVSVPVTMTVEADSYGVALSGDDAMSSAPGDVVTYTLTVTNAGNVMDTFNIAISGETWSATAPASVMVNAGASTTFDVAVTIPAGANDADSDVATVTVTSANDAAATDSADLTTTAVIAPVYSVELSGDDAMSGAPGDVVTYTLTVTNAGNVMDTFNIATSGETWSATAPASVMVNAGASTTFDVAVTIPAGANDADSDVATVTVTSANDAGATDSADLTTTAVVSGPTMQYIYLPVIFND